MSWFWSSGGSILTQIKKMQAANYNKTLPSPVNHRRSTEFLTLQKHAVSSILTSKLGYLVFLCYAWFNTIPGTWEMLSQVAFHI